MDLVLEGQREGGGAGGGRGGRVTRRGARAAHQRALGYRRLQHHLVDAGGKGACAVDDRRARHVQLRLVGRADGDAAHARAAGRRAHRAHRRRRQRTGALGSRRLEQLRAHLLRVHPSRAAAVEERRGLRRDEAGRQLAEEGLDRLSTLIDAQAVDGRVVRQLGAAVQHSVGAVHMHRAARVTRRRRGSRLRRVSRRALGRCAQEAVAATVHRESVFALGRSLLKQVDAPVHERGHRRVLAPVIAVALSRER